jgi:hypothetical protein
VTATNGAVEVLGPQRRQASVGDALLEGTRVRVPEGASLTLAMPGGATLVARDHAELFVFGDPSTLATGRPSAQRDTVARRGTFVLSTPPEGAPLSLVTPSCTIVLHHGEALVRTDARRTRFVVLRGRARLRAMGRETLVREHQGGKVELNRPPVVSSTLAPPTVQPQSSPAYTFGGAAEVLVRWSAPRGAAAAQWRVQLSREQDFSTLVHDQTVAATVNEARVSLPSGRYFARVFGVDANEIEGRFSATQRFDVAGPRVIPGRPGRVARVEVPAGMRCGLNSSPPALQPGPMELTPGRHHVLRCIRGDGPEVFEMPISAEESGPLNHQLRITSDVSTDQRTLELRLTDARGYGVPYATVRVEAPEGATVERVVEAAERGTYNATVRWPPRVGRGRLRFVINDAVTFEEVVEP